MPFGISNRNSASIQPVIEEAGYSIWVMKQPKVVGCHTGGQALTAEVTSIQTESGNVKMTIGASHKGDLYRVPTQFSKTNSMTFHDFSLTFSMTFPLHLKHFFHACLSDIYTCKLVTVLSGFFLRKM